MSDTILVTGASGHLGRAIITHLLDSQKVAPARLIAATRDTSKVADLAARGVAVRKADFDDADGLEQAFAGVGTVLIVSTDALDGAGTRLRQHKTAVAAAAKAGVKRIAYTSLPNSDTSKVSFAPDHLGSEGAIKATGLPYLIFRNSWYLENLFMSLPQALKSGQWYTSAADGKTAFVARDDIAAAIAGALANPPATSTTYTLSGDEALTNDQIAALASEITGKPLQVVHLTDEQLAGGMKAAGVPDAYIPTFVSFDAATRTGDLATLTGDTARLSGRKPQSVRAFITANKAALAG
jgi:NAD(P)H dehydrogenase (quinone)